MPCVPRHAAVLGSAAEDITRPMLEDTALLTHTVSGSTPFTDVSEHADLLCLHILKQRQIRHCQPADRVSDFFVTAQHVKTWQIRQQAKLQGQLETTQADLCSLYVMRADCARRQPDEGTGKGAR